MKKEEKKKVTAQPGALNLRSSKSLSSVTKKRANQPFSLVHVPLYMKALNYMPFF